MEGRLLVTPGELINKAGSFQAKAMEVKTLHDDMLARVTGLSGTWNGEAAEAYRSKFASLQASMDKINRMIMEHSRDLQEMAEQYQAAEGQAQSAANDLPASTLD